MSQEHLFRLLVSPLFLVSGLGHILRKDHFVNRLREGNLGAMVAEWVSVDLLIVGSGIVLLIGGACLAFGLKTKLATRILVALLIPITVVGQTKGVEDIGPFLKNLAIIGSLLYFASALENPLTKHTKNPT